MLFKWIMVYLLNRLLEKYFEHIDESQIKLGIWSGAIIFNNLRLKNACVEDARLPFKVILGYLGSVTLKIPWYGLYTNEVKLKLSELFILVTPADSVLYNEPSENVAAEALKKKEIERIEKARNKSKILANSEKRRTQTFSERLVSQIFKNLRISVDSLHVRYEDTLNNPQSPFAFGVALQTFKLETTDEDWNPTTIRNRDTQIIYKMAKLKGLSVYCNPNTDILQDKYVNDILDEMKNLVENKNASLTYILGPVSSEAKVQFNPSPETGSSALSEPKLIINLMINEILLALTNSQFQGIIDLVKSIEFLSRAKLYRKYKHVNVNCNGNRKARWKFAYQCIIEEEVRRRHTNWSWVHMKRHRQLCAIYFDAYFTKLTSKKVNAEMEFKASHCEKELDVFNITLVRKQVKLRVKDLRRSHKKQAVESRRWYSWWPSWFSGSKENTDTNGFENIEQNIRVPLTNVGNVASHSTVKNCENSIAFNFPNNYLKYIFNFHLDNLRLAIKDSATANEQEQTILMLDIRHIEAILSSRPLRKGLTVQISVGDIEAGGVKDTPDSRIPQIIVPKDKSENQLFNVMYEHNPLDSHLYNLTRVEVYSTRALVIVYHAKTIVHLVNAFSLPKEIQLEKHPTEKISSLKLWTVHSTAALQNLMEPGLIVEIDIRIIGTYILVPQNGLLDKNGSVLVLHFGEILVNSEARHSALKPHRKSCHSDDKFSDTVFTEIYDSFIVTLKDFVLFLALPGEHDLDMLHKADCNATDFIVADHILKSDELIVTFSHCRVSNDPRLPRLKLEINLPLLDSDIAECRFLELLKLLTTLPLSPSEEPICTHATPVVPNLRNSELPFSSHSTREVNHKKEKKMVELFKMLLSINIKSIKVQITQVNDQRVAVPLVSCEINQLEAMMIKKTYSYIKDITIVGVTVWSSQNSVHTMNIPLYLLKMKTPSIESCGAPFLKVHMSSILPDCVIGIVTDELKHCITADIFGLDVILHREFLINMSPFFAQITTIMEKLMETAETSVTHSTSEMTVHRKPKLVKTSRKTLPFSVYFSLSETDLFLVESMVDSDNHNAITLHCDMNLSQKIVDSKENIMGCINNVKLSTCKYYPENTNQELVEIMDTYSITFVMNRAPEKGTLIDINISSIFIKLTADTVKLLLKISSIFCVSPDPENRLIMENHSQLWEIKSNDEMNLWFLKQDVTDAVTDEALEGTEVGNQIGETVIDSTHHMEEKEIIVVESGPILITFETGVGKNTLPVLLIETNFDLQAHDWSSKLQLCGKINCEAAYFNPIYGKWEHLIEPVELRSNGQVSYRPWEMLFEYTLGDAADNSAELSPLSSENAESVQCPATFTIQSTDILEFTVTKTGLQVINTLTEELNTAVSALVHQRVVSTAPYTVVNDTGTDMRIILENSSFSLIHETSYFYEVLLKPGTSINLSLADSFKTTNYASIIHEQRLKEDHVLKIEIPDFNFNHEVLVSKAEKRCYHLDQKNDSELQHSLLVDITVMDLSKIVTFRSMVQILNHLDVGVSIYYMEEISPDLQLLGNVCPAQKLNIPLKNVHTRTGVMYFAPEGFCISETLFIWKTLMTELQVNADISCLHREEANRSFNIKVVGESQQAFHGRTATKSLSSQCRYIHLSPPFAINNLLPCKLGYYLGHRNLIRIAEEGATIQMCDIAVNKAENYKFTLKIPSYDGQSWICDIAFVKSTALLSQWRFKSETIKNNSMTLGIHTQIDNHTVTFHVYCPFWMVNRTGLKLFYKGTENDAAIIQHPDVFNTPRMLTFHGKAFLTKKKAHVKIEDSSWSDKFSLDLAGTSGIVTCKSPFRNYEIGVEFQLNSWGLTRTVIFTPKYYLINQCSFDFVIKETDQPEYPNLVKAGTCVGFWPRSSVQFLTAIVKGTSEESKPFSYDKVDHILLKLLNNYGGLYVDVHVTDSKSLVKISEIIDGHAPVLIVNGTSGVHIEVGEKGSSDSRLIAPGYSQYFTWADPIGDRTMVWCPATNKEKTLFTDRLKQDSCGSFIYEKDDNKKEMYYWISFLNGLQRVMLYTADPELVTNLQVATYFQNIKSEYTVMLQGIGLSIVDNEKFKEILYVRIKSSEAVWESREEGKSKPFRALTAEMSQEIEFSYQTFLNEKAISSTINAHVTMDSGIEVDFLDLQMYKPFLRQIRRSFQCGIWVHYKKSLHTAQLHAKIHRLQIDNQMSDCIFPVVLAPVPPPKSLAITNDHQKPFAEISIMQCSTAHSSVIQYKYFKVLVQEFHVRMDYSLITSIIDLLEHNFSTAKSEQMYRKEYTEACTSVDECNARQIKFQGRKHIFGFLHLSPLKVHLSFSMSGSGPSSNEFLNLILKSVGVSVTEMQDIVFKLSCLELQHELISGDQLYTEIYSHYLSQTLKQFYVLVFGLDVLGNPFGFATAVSKGIESFFYEPMNGAIQGPGEFAEGLSLGIRHLIEGTVGGTFGAFSKISGTLGKAIAGLTLDDKYQKKRLANLNQPTHNVARSGKYLVQGLFNGVRGVVAEPLKGAKEKGITGFFQGLGRGAIGVVTHPTVGLVDFASTSFAAMKKATSTSEEVQRMRPPRYVPKESILQPYVQHEAEGLLLFHELQKRQYVDLDTYWAHAVVNPHGKFVVFLTDRRIVYLKGYNVFGEFSVSAALLSVVWTHLWKDFVGVPDVAERVITFQMKLSKKKKLKTVEVYNVEVCTLLMKKIEMAMGPFLQQ